MKGNFLTQNCFILLLNLNQDDTDTPKAPPREEDIRVLSLDNTDFLIEPYVVTL